MRGDGAVFLRGDVWWLRFSADGKEYRMSAETTKKSEALSKLRNELAKYRTGQFVEPQARAVTVAQLMDDLWAHHKLHGKLAYEKVSRRRWELHAGPFFGRVKAAQFGTSLQREYQLKRKAEGSSVASINRELALVSGAFHLAHASEPPKVSRLPKFLFLKEDNARKVFVTEEQLTALRAAAVHEGLGMKALIELAYTLGWRKGELLKLRVADIDLPGGTIRIETSKNGEAREVPVTPGLRVLLEALVVGHKPEDRLIQLNGDLRYAWRRTCKRAGITGLNFHDFRRTSARVKRSLGVSTSVIMELQGWKTESMFRRYAITDRSDKMAALMLMEAPNGRPTDAN